MIWEPFLLALFLGLIVSAGLYFAYLWPSAEPSDAEPATVAADSPEDNAPPPSEPAEEEPEPAPETKVETAAEAEHDDKPADETSPAS